MPITVAESYRIVQRTGTTALTGTTPRTGTTPLTRQKRAHTSDSEDSAEGE